MPGRRTPAPVVLRELRWEDFPARVASYLALYDEVKENPDLGMTLTENLPKEVDEVDWFAGLYRQTLTGQTVAVVGEVDGRAVGLVTVSAVRQGGQRTENAHVGTLGILVDRSYRGQGVGDALLRRALELARDRVEIVRLIVFSVNVRAKRLYERFGFRTTGRLEREIKRNGRYLDVEMMTLDLKGWKAPPPRTSR
jgi:RimJ/RimL family protein N-acetyltransferase